MHSDGGVAPEMISADVELYQSDAGGRQTATPATWFGCVILVAPDATDGWDCRIFLGGQPLRPGECRRVEMRFLSGAEPSGLARNAGRVFLWERGIIGEARIVG